MPFMSRMIWSAGEVFIASPADRVYSNCRGICSQGTNAMNRPYDCPIACT